MYTTDVNECEKMMATSEYIDILNTVNADWEKITETIEATDSQGYSYEGVVVYNGDEYYFSFNCGDCDIRPFLSDKQDVALQVYESIKEKGEKYE